jgi:cellobiose epimerase
MVDELNLDLRQRVEKDLTENTLKFWMKYTPDRKRGGFYGLVTNDLRIYKDAPRAAVICGRILWTFSAAYRRLGKPEYRDMAQHAFAYLTQRFWDAEYGGVYWMLDGEGQALNSRKQIYAQAFALYGLVEYYRAVQDPAALALAQRLFHLIEEQSYDRRYGGYYEAYNRDWSALSDWRLSDKDLNSPKSMNTMLHILEAYSNLLRVWPDAQLKQKQKELIEVFLKHIIDPDKHHFKLFFSEDWTSLSDHISFGHDIEGTWLLTEAVGLLGDPQLDAQVKMAAIQIAEAVYEEGLDADGSLLYEADPQRITNSDKHWWAQAEAVVGFYNTYQLTGDERYARAAHRAWDYIETRVIDHHFGEWYAQLKRDGTPYSEQENPEQNKVGPWKCPYHNSRACLEMMERIG